MVDTEVPLPSVLGAIGNTPLVELSRVTAGIDGRILMKLEYLNPGFSKKDRAALRIINLAEKSGHLVSGQTVVELTSGNMGAGLAIVCGIKGYPFIAVMSSGNSTERVKMMRALGAEVILVDQNPDSVPGQVSGADLELVRVEARKLTKKLDAFRADQFEHEGNQDAHYHGTGPELWEQSGHVVSAFCDFAGSGGTFSGCSRYLKEQDPAIQCFIVEPEKAASLSGRKVTNPNHPIQGGGYAMDSLAQIKDCEPDGYLQVTSADAMKMTRRLAKEEGIFAGFSSGANVAAAMHLLQGSLRGAVVGVIACDSGLKYLTTDLWS